MALGLQVSGLESGGVQNKSVKLELGDRSEEELKAEEEKGEEKGAVTVQAKQPSPHLPWDRKGLPMWVSDLNLWNPVPLGGPVGSHRLASTLFLKVRKLRPGGTGPVMPGFPLICSPLPYWE